MPKNDPKIVTNLPDIAPQALYPDGIGVNASFGALGIVYRTDKFEQNKIAAPASYEDFYRPELKGRVAVVNTSSIVGTLFLLGLAEVNGGSVTNVDPGFTALKRQ